MPRSSSSWMYAFFVISSLFLVSSSLFFSPAVCFINFFSFWIICQNTSVWAWATFLSYSEAPVLQLAEDEMKVHCIPCRWWNAPPLYFQHTIQHLLKLSLSLFHLLSPVLSSLSSLPIFTFFSVFLISLLPLNLVSLLPPSFCCPPAFHCFLTLSFSTTSLSLSISVPLRLSQLGTLYFLSPSLAACVYYLRWGRRDGEHQPFWGFSSDSPSSAYRCILKYCVGLSFVPPFNLFQFILHPVPTPACYVKIHMTCSCREQGGWIMKMDHLRLWTEDTFLLYLIWMKSHVKL